MVIANNDEHRRFTMRGSDIRLDTPATRAFLNDYVAVP
jgi:hypothetical protein